jgi:hypothetical protein
MAKAAVISEDATLCERCGYVLDGIGADEVCPECGTPVRESLPEARHGSGWQRRPGIGSWLRVSWQALVHPLVLFRSMRPVADRRTWLLLWLNVAIGTGAPGVMWFIVAKLVSGPGIAVWYLRPALAASTPASNSGTLVIWGDLLVPRPMWVAAIAIPAMAGTLLALTWIETVGVRFFGSRRGWRVTWPIALSVCAHASIGWALGGVLHAIVPLARTPMWWVLDQLPESVAATIAFAYVKLAPVLAVAAGMLIFETLVYVGVRECRYANAAGKRA